MCNNEPNRNVEPPEYDLLTQGGYGRIMITKKNEKDKEGIGVTEEKQKMSLIDAIFFGVGLVVGWLLYYLAA